MKILHVVQNYFPSKGGTQTLFKEISERLVKNYGDEVTVCTTDSYYGPEKKFYKNIRLAEEVINGVTVKRFSFLRFHLRPLRLLHKVLAVLKLKTPGQVTRYIHGPWSPAMQNFINNFDGDVICASSCNYLFMLYPLQKPTKPFVFMGALHFKEDAACKPVGSKVLEAIRRSTFYIANTGFEKARLFNYGVNNNRIKVVGCGVDVDAFAAKRSPVDFRSKYNIGTGQIVGYVGRHEPFKGIGLLLDAMERLWRKGAGYQLVIAGLPTNYTAVLQQKVARLNTFSAYVTFITDFTDEDKVDIYNSLDVFVSVSTEESFGIVYLEAWACKKPVIGANIGAVKSVIDDGVNGYLVDPLDAVGLSAKIESLCSLPEKKKSMGENGYNKVIAQYTWDIITARYRDIYVQAVP